MQARVRAEGIRGRWVSPHQFHVTLRFLGEIEPGDVPGVVEAMREEASASSGFALTCRGVGAFPDWKTPRVIWAGVSEGAGEARRIAHGLERRLSRRLGASLRPAGKSFHPHVTLARVQGLPPLMQPDRLVRACGALQAGPADVSEIVLFRSRLTSAGPEYEELESVRLGQTFTKSRSDRQQ